MTREELTRALRTQTQCVRMSGALAERTLLAAQGKERPYMKKKVSLALVFALLTVMLCAAAIAAANRWGMLDFVDSYATAHYIPEDAQNYVHTDVAAMENEWVTINVRELYYDGRVSRVTVDVTPKEEHTLLVDESIFLEDPFVNLTNNYIEGGDNDMRSVLQVIKEEGYESVYSVSVFLKGTQDDIGMGTGDCMLGDDGTLTLYWQEEYMTDMPRRDISISVILMPFDKPLEADSRSSHEKAAVLEVPVTLVASVNPTDDPVKTGEIPNVYVSEAGADYPAAGVHVDRIILEVKPQEIYAAVEYSVTDREKFDALEGGLWFEFIDPARAGEPWEQRLTEGLTGGGAAMAMDEDADTAAHYRQTQTLGKNELRETYTLRAFDAWEKNRFETHEIRMRPATAEDMEK